MKIPSKRNILNDEKNNIERICGYAGQTLRAVLVFDKPQSGSIGTSGYGNDVDVVLLDMNKNIMESSQSSYNNVEVFEFTFETSGYYYFNVVFHETIVAPERTILTAVLAYGVE